MRKVRVNIRTAVNTTGIRRERRAGRDKIIVPSATLPDGVVMNGIRYPGDEIEGKGAGTGYKTLNQTLAPLGHPTIEGAFVSASHPEGINVGWIGAHNENVRRENGRVFLDKVIDVARASESVGGQAVLAAIEKGEPIHTSTGLFCELENCDGDQPDSAQFIARNMVFDHDAILLGEEGAAKPDQGVGMMVNGQKIEVINSSMMDMADQEIDWAGTRLVEALKRKENLSVWEKVKTAIMEALSPEREPSTNKKEYEMTVSKEQFDALSAKVNAISDTVEKLDIAAVVANAVTEAIKPVADQITAMNAAEKAKADTEKSALVDAVVSAGLLEKADAEELTIKALNSLAGKAKPGIARGLSAAFTQNVADEFAEYDINNPMGVK